jgi:hypothetical protein
VVKFVTLVECDIEWKKAIVFSCIGAAYDESFDESFKAVADAFAPTVTSRSPCQSGCVIM